jgi:hypothetical protein
MPASSRNNDQDGRPLAGLGALRRFAQERRPAPQAPVEHCDLCNDVVLPEHRHLLDLNSRSIACACHPCALLFDNQGAGGKKYRLIPQRRLALQAFQMSDEQWDELLIPVGMAFLFTSSGAKPVMAFYPSPAGPTESLLSLEGWQALAASNPLLNELEPDVEALLINRVEDAREYYIAPIDACYQLVGLIRINWRGFSGGEAVWEAIHSFFAELRARAELVGGADDARPEL